MSVGKPLLPLLFHHCILTIVIFSLKKKFYVMLHFSPLYVTMNAVLEGRASGFAALEYLQVNMKVMGRCLERWNRWYLFCYVLMLEKCPL